jgi:hypothetical protein
MPVLQKYKGVVYLWEYVPSLSAAIVFAILFLLITLFHIHKMVRTKMWFCIPFVIGGICMSKYTPKTLPSRSNINYPGEPIGYLCRALTYNHTSSLILYLLQSLFLLLPPVLFAGTLYMVYSRVVRSVHGESHSLISPRWCTRIFVLGDLVCLNIQSTGGGLTGNDKKLLVDIGNWIVVAGLFIQILVFVGFMWCCVVFHLRFRGYLESSGRRSDIPWESILYMLYGTSVLISIRNIFRLVEYIMGKGSYLFAHEWPIYVFDGVLMLVVMIVFWIWYPDQLRMGRTESMIELRSEGGEEDGGKIGSGT